MNAGLLTTNSQPPTTNSQLRGEIYEKLLLLCRNYVLKNDPGFLSEHNRLIGAA